ncbi:MAG: nucleotide disphospho-sugar-binding domain-containing protein [bacterium]
MSKLKVLCIPFGPALSHVFHCLSVADALKKQGHQVVFATGKERCQFIKDTGYVVYPIAAVKKAEVEKAMGMNWYTKELVDQCVGDELHVINEYKPNVIINSFCPTPNISARIAKVPNVGIISSPFLKGILARSNRSEKEVFAEIMDGETILQKIGNVIKIKVLKTLLKTFNKKWTKPFNIVLEKYGLPKTESMFDLYLGDLNLVEGIPDFCPIENLPPSAYYVGCLEWGGLEKEIPDWLKELDHHYPVIYVTLGTRVKNKKKIYQKIIYAFQDAKYQVIISMGGGAETLQDLVPYPSHIRIEQFVPGPTMINASDIVIHHGGYGTVMETLRRGIPNLCIPFSPEQATAAQAIHNAECGLRLTPHVPFQFGFRNFTIEDLQKSVKEILNNPKYKQNAGGLQKNINQYSSEKKIVRYIEEFVEGWGNKN